MHPPSQELAALEARLVKVERHNRLLTWSLGALTVLSLAVIVTLAVSLLAATPKPSVQHIDASSLILWEQGARPTINLGAYYRPDDNSVALQMSDRIWGASRGHVLLDHNQTALVLLDDEHNPRIVLRYSKDESGLTLLDEKQKKRAELLCTKEGPVFRLLDENEQPVFSKP
jgi:hypothetical protein